ncbi:MAG: PIN domain-containing protein [Prosthecobacter sp.]|uniref:PIN domain-containing protein n=1 Tax=Prosthecobacter sp. TaxID=1965333 RepID=UPI003BB14990
MTDVYLLDTNIICALADATRTTHDSAVRRLEGARDFVLLPSPAVGEIEFGMAKALNLKPDKRQILRDFIADFTQMPFDEHCVEPYAFVRAELWLAHGTPKARPGSHKEHHPEDLLDKVTGSMLGIDEPDLLIASIAMAQNLVLVTDDRNDGMMRVKQAADAVFQKGHFPIQLRVENWLEASF